MQRYTQSFLGLFEQSNTGRYVKYNDHMKAVERLECEHSNYIQGTRDKHAVLRSSYTNLLSELKDSHKTETLSTIYSVLVSIALVLVLLFG